MAKGRATRWKSFDNESQPQPNRSTASSSNTAPTFEAPESRPTPLPPRVTRLVPAAQPVQQPATSPSEAAAVAPDADPDDGFRSVERRHRPIRSPFESSERHAIQSASGGVERRAVRFASDVQPYSTTTDYSADPRLDSYLNYLFARLHEAISDPQLDYDEIMAEIHRLNGARAQTSTTPAEDLLAHHNASESRSQDLFSLFGAGGDAAPPSDGGGPPFAISIDNEDHFPELGAPRRPSNTDPSSSSQWPQFPRGASPSPEVSGGYISSWGDEVPTPPAHGSGAPLAIGIEHEEHSSDLEAPPRPVHDNAPDSSSQDYFSLMGLDEESTLSADGGGLPWAISVYNEEDFPALGAPRRPAQDDASGSSQGRQISWRAMLRARTTPAPQTEQYPPAGPYGFPRAEATYPGAPHHRDTPPVVPLPPPQAPAVAGPAQLSLVDLRKLAEDASVLLELYSKTASDDSRDANQQLIDSAFASIGTLNRHHRVLASARNGGGVAAQKRPENEDLTIDAGCIICYSEFADTVLLPCHHLVLCTLCCDMMGMKGNGVWAVKVRCPMCRTHVVDRIKIFR